MLSSFTFNLILTVEIIVNYLGSRGYEALIIHISVILLTISNLNLSNFHSRLETHLFLTEDRKPQVDCPTYHMQSFCQRVRLF